MNTIFTLNARGNIYLDVVSDYFQLKSNEINREIQVMHQELIQILNSKGIKYQNLKSALVPLSHKQEAGFIFDSTLVKSCGYGREIMGRILPLLEKNTTQSILSGDLLGNDQEFIYDILRSSLIASRTLQFVHGTLVFCVYINNLTQASLSRVHKGLAQYEAYVGYIPTTFSSISKAYLSTTLSNVCIKNKSNIIIGHEDDRPNNENINISHYPFEELGYTICSIQSLSFSLFLSFKIERAIFKGFEDDTDYSINAVSDKVHQIDGFDVLLEEAKHTYLLSKKEGKIRKAGVEKLSTSELSLLIKSKISKNYIYNMAYSKQYDVIKFNIMIEADREDGGYPEKLTAVIEYMPEDNILRLISLH